MPTLNLKKGNSLNLSKNNPNLKKVKVGLGWDTGDQPIDLDAWCFAKFLDKDTEACYYNNLSLINDGIKHTGDNRSGVGDGDDETILIDLDKVNNTTINEIDLSVIIFNEDVNLTFGKVKNSYIRLINQDTNEEIAIYKLEDEFFSSKSVLFGTLVKENNEWKFNAVGKELVSGVTDATTETVKLYGFN